MSNCICINTDDPKMFHNTLAEEFVQLQAQLGITRDEVRRLIMNGIAASWQSERGKQKMTESFLASPHWAEER